MRTPLRKTLMDSRLTHGRNTLVEAGMKILGHEGEKKLYVQIEEIDYIYLIFCCPVYQF